MNVGGRWSAANSKSGDGGDEHNGNREGKAAREHEREGGEDARRKERGVGVRYY